MLLAGLLASVEHGLNRVLRLDSTALPRLAALEGKVIAIDCLQPALQLYILPDEDGLLLAAHWENEADCTLRAPASSLVQLALAKDKTAVLHSPQVQLNALFYLAEVTHDRGTPQLCHMVLRLAFAVVRLADLHDVLAAPPAAMATLCATALQARIEPDTVKRLIQAHRLQPTPAESMHWPWPVRIHTLGRFGLVLDDESLIFSGKSPRKALELLQVLIASGGREVSTSALMHVLWPEESSSNLRNLFDNTLHRLRRILGPADALPMGNAKLALDPRHCWVDTWTFSRLTAACSLPATLDAAGQHPP